MTKVLVVAEMTARDLLRRRGAFALMVAVPLLFYAARRDSTGMAVRFVGLGLGWVVAAASAFSGMAARNLDPRLRLSGYRTWHLALGRLLSLSAIALVAGAGYLAIVLVDQDIARPGAVTLAFVLTAVVAVPLGLLVSTLLPRELEVTLVLFAVLGLQMLLDPAGTSSRFLPFWSLRELATYAIDMVDEGYLRRGVVHGVAVGSGLLLLFAATFAARLRTRPHLRAAQRAM